MAITRIVLDFDGTCTQIPIIYQPYLDRYLQELNNRIFSQKHASPEQWNEAQETVRAHSPKAGWTISTTPAAPAAADPYILAFESTKLLSKNLLGTVVEPPFEAHRDSNEANPAPWRPEAREVIEKLLAKGISVCFISNSSSTKIKQRLTDLLDTAQLPQGLSVHSDANKFRISEPPFYSDLSASDRAIFDQLPVVSTVNVSGRPVYLRRGFYFEAIARALGGFADLSSTVFCGDIWEMDLALPQALGANIHLLERARPFETYDFERTATQAAGTKARISADLNGLLDWL